MGSSAIYVPDVKIIVFRLDVFAPKMWHRTELLGDVFFVVLGPKKVRTWRLKNIFSITIYINKIGTIGIPP